MAVSDTITSMGVNIGASYDMVETMGGTAAGQKNLANLPDSIATIPASAPVEMGPYGRVLWMDGNQLHGYGLQTLGDFSSLCTSGAATDTVSINGQQIVKEKIISFEWGENFPTAIPLHFMSHFTSLLYGNAGQVPSGVTSIGSFFLNDCQIFNQELSIPETVRTIGSNFLAGCTMFDHAVTIPAQVSTIDLSFMGRCKKFNSALTITATSVTGIDSFFLYGCETFNQPLTINGSNLTIGSNFLSGATRFNSTLTFTGTISTIGNYFLQRCQGFNKQLKLIGTGVTSIGSYFLSDCQSLAQRFTIPNTVTSIGERFCQNTAFDLLSWEAGSSITTIPDYFMYNCPRLRFFQTSDFPETVTTIGSHFYASCARFEAANMNALRVSTIGDYFMSDCPALNHYIYVYAESIGDYFMSNCLAFNSPISLGTTLKSIGSGFLSGCGQFNKSISFPSSLTSIGNNFMASCVQMAQPLTIPATITSIGTGFMRGVAAFIGPLTVGSSAAPADMYTLTSTYSAATSYTKGITLAGVQAELWKSKLPDRNTTPFRKLIVASTAEASNTLTISSQAKTTAQQVEQPIYERFVDPDTGEERWHEIKLEE